MDEKPKTTLTDGSPVTADHKELKPNGQQKGYVVLSEEERAKGFVRPVRHTYIHVGKNPVMEGNVLIKPSPEACGQRTTMNDALAKTYARDPHFYSGTFCTTCRTHRPVGEPEFGGEFVWEGTSERVGT